jgi:hypothetical protein
MTTPSRIATPERRDDEARADENKLRGVTSGNSRSLNVVGIVLIFIGIGPLVGGFFYCLLGGVFQLFLFFLQGQPPKGFLELIVSVLMAVLMLVLAPIAAAPYSYMYGAAPAAVAGLAIGVLRLKYGELNVPLVLAVGAVVGIIYCLALPRLPSAGFPFNVGARSGLGAGEYVLLGLGCVLATLACWRFVRSYPLPGE